MDGNALAGLGCVGCLILCALVCFVLMCAAMARER